MADFYEPLFSAEDPSSVSDVHEKAEPEFLDGVKCRGRGAIACAADAGTRFQFEREGYFISDSEEHSSDKPVFNQIVSLRDSYKPA